MNEVIGIFPTPLMIAKGALPRDLVDAMIAQFEQDQDVSANVRTTLLTHTPMESPRSHANYKASLEHILPRVREYGISLLGESLSWAVKEIWINRMDTGGEQKLHNHANSFVSGVAYLTHTEGRASTVFHRSAASDTFKMTNENKNCQIGPFNAPVFQMPPMEPGDMVLFPSYMMHEVPPNQGEPRMTAAFNALPERLDSWGYTLNFR